MATDEPMAPTRRITLTRNQRDALHALVADELPHVFGGDPVNERGLASIREILDDARPHLVLLDAIGWDPEADRERYELDVDVDWLRGVLQRRRRDYLGDLEHERRALIGARAGDDSWLVDGDSFADAERRARSTIDRDLDELGRIDVALEALGETGRS